MKCANLKYYEWNNNPPEVHLAFLQWFSVYRLVNAVPQMCWLHCWLGTLRLSWCGLGRKALPSAHFLTWLDGFGEATSAAEETRGGRYPSSCGEMAAASELRAEKKICPQLYKFLLDLIPSHVYL